MNEVFMIPMMALTIPIIVAPIAIVTSLFRKRREMEHLERMRALELGRTLLKDEPWWNPGRMAVSIAVAVPLGSMAMVWAATESLGHQAEPIQVMGGMVAVGGVLLGGVLTWRHMSWYHRHHYGDLAQANHKPVYDPDAFDVVSRRG